MVKKYDTTKDDKNTNPPDKRLELLKKYVKNLDRKGTYKRMSEENRKGWENLLIENGLEVKNFDEFAEYIKKKKEEYL